jgi:hypothetical protein
VLHDHRFPATHGVVKAHPDLFEVEGSDVEQASAAPGEKRARRRLRTT